MKRLCLLLMFLALPALAHAQIVLNPTQVDFAASADHNVTSFGGTAVVTSYEVSWIAQNVTGAVAFTKSLGKPAPNASGRIIVTVPELATIAVETEFKAKIATLGPGGSAVSPDSLPFGRPGPPRLPVATPAPVLRP